MNSAEKRSGDALFLALYSTFPPLSTSLDSSHSLLFPNSIVYLDLRRFPLMKPVWESGSKW